MHDPLDEALDQLRKAVTPASGSIASQPPPDNALTEESDFPKEATQVELNEAGGSITLDHPGKASTPFTAQEEKDFAARSDTPAVGPENASLKWPSGPSPSPMPEPAKDSFQNLDKLDQCEGRNNSRKGPRLSGRRFRWRTLLSDLSEVAGKMKFWR